VGPFSKILMEELQPRLTVISKDFKQPNPMELQAKALMRLCVALDAFSSMLSLNMARIQQFMAQTEARLNHLYLMTPEGQEQAALMYARWLWIDGQLAL
jgi:hypothetical protein